MGFIEFEDNENAKYVLESLNGKPISGSNKLFKLNWASFGNGNSKFNGGSKNDPNSQEFSVSLL